MHRSIQFLEVTSSVVSRSLTIRSAATGLYEGSGESSLPCNVGYLHPGKLGLTERSYACTGRVGPKGTKGTDVPFAAGQANVLRWPEQPVSHNWKHEGGFWARKQPFPLNNDSPTMLTLAVKMPPPFSTKIKAYKSRLKYWNRAI